MISFIITVVSQLTIMKINWAKCDRDFSYSAHLLFADSFFTPTVRDNIMNI